MKKIYLIAIIIMIISRYYSFISNYFINFSKSHTFIVWCNAYCFRFFYSFFLSFFLYYKIYFFVFSCNRHLMSGLNVIRKHIYSVTSSLSQSLHYAAMLWHRKNLLKNNIYFLSSNNNNNNNNNNNSNSSSYSNKTKKTRP